MKKPLWKPSEDRIKQSNISRFMNLVNERHELQIVSYDQLYEWSVENIQAFWSDMWDFGQIKASRPYDEIIDRLDNFPGAAWFKGARLNFAENLLKHKDENLSFIFKGETMESTRLTYTDLYHAVARLALSLHRLGLTTGDRVAAYMPNIVETAIGMLASTSLGGIWASCGTELGPSAVVDRLSQITPKVLLTTNAYPYKGKVFDIVPRLQKISEGVPSLEKVIVVPYMGREPAIDHVRSSVFYDDFISAEKRPELSFKQLAPDHPVYIMFSSGTTGKPKCMVQGAAGVLINHLKELLLHTDLMRRDRILYITTPSWMMWNWLISSLAVGATVVLYDGNPNYPDWRNLWKLIEDERVTVFGCSASYINYLENAGASPRRYFELSSLKEISQTGSPLSEKGFEYVYQEIKSDLHFNSISGGTDINGCFAAGSPIQPVYAGELQGPALAMRIKAYDADGNPVVNSEGELVCEAPAPSMPLHFWSDPQGEKYRKAYFDLYPGVWRHGDWIVIHGDTGGITFLGRSDFTLKPSGVRIGPAEIYNVVERFKEVADSLVAGQDWRGDQRVILFVMLSAGYSLTEDLMAKLKKALREEASPRHVPALIIETPQIPYTFSMKKVESAVVNILNGRPVTNRDALMNPESLDFYERVSSDLK